MDEHAGECDEREFDDAHQSGEDDRRIGGAADWPDIDLARAASRAFRAGSTSRRFARRVFEALQIAAESSHGLPLHSG